MTIVLMVANIIGGYLITRLGARRLIVLGQLLAASGYLLLLLAVMSGSYALLIVPMLMAAGGLALVVPTITNVTLSAVEPSRAGLASGVLNTARQVGGMLGVAVCGSLVRDVAEAAFMRGMLLSLALAVVLLLASALLAYLRLDRSEPQRKAHDPERSAKADHRCPA